MLEVTIRDMETADLEKSVSLIRKAIIISNSKDYSKGIIKNLLNHYSFKNFKLMYNSRKFFVASRENRIVGTVACENNKIYSLFVDPDHQKSGIGKILLKKIENYILKQGYRKAELSASITAVPFYMANGYIKVKRVFNDKLGDVIVMEKNISD